MSSIYKNATKENWITRVVFLSWLGLVAAISVGSLIPIETIPSVPSLLSDKIQHAGAYFLLGLLAVFGSGTLTVKVSMFCLSFLVGILIEFLQPLTGRHFEVNDMVANSAGLLLSLLVSALLLWRKKKT